MGIDWIGLFDRLLPNSRAWSLVHDGPLRKYFSALSVANEITREHMASTILELFPQYTSMLRDWSLLFGSPVDYTNEELTALWGVYGGQDPQYIQDRLQSLDVDVYLHEWWEPGSDPPVARNPIPYLDSSYVLVNDVTTVEKRYTYQFGDGTQFGDGAEFGQYDGYYLHRKRYPCPDVVEEYPVYWYVGGANWPDYALIPDDKLEKLIRLIFKIKPVQTRVILRVTTYDSGVGAIQDVATLTEPQWQDVSTGGIGDIQDE